MKSIFESRTSRAGLLAATLLVPLSAFGALALPSGHAVTHAAADVAALRQVTVRVSAPHLPKSIPAGVIALTLVNDTKSGASAGLGRANPGATLAQINAVSAGNSVASFIRLTQLVTFLGGPDSVPAGGSETAILDLRTPGLYGLNLNRDDGTSVTYTFKATPGAGQRDVLPAADTTVTIKSMRFLALPKHFSPGTVTFMLANHSKWVHEMVVTRLHAGKTIQDVRTLLKSPTAGFGPPPAWMQSVGGLGSVSGKQTAAVSLKLTPGYYVMLCFMPDVKKNGMPHAAEGMLANFTVS